MAARKLDFISMILTVLSFVAWLIAMAGTAALDSQAGISAWEIGYGWWAVWFQFFVLVYTAFVSCANFAAAARLRTYLMLMVTVVWMQVADKARVAIDSKQVDGDYKTSTQAILAGAIMILILNFLLIIYWSLTNDGDAPISLRRAAPTEAQGPAPKGEAPPEAAPVPAPSVTTV